MAKGQIQASLTLNKKLYSAGLAEALKEAKAFSASLSGAAKISLPAPQTSGLKQANTELKEQNALVKAARDAVSDLRVSFERNEISRKDFIRDAQTLDRELVDLRETALTIPSAISGLNRALGTNARGLQTARGELSRLGLSQQINVALNNQLSTSLANSGRLGSAASLGIAAYGGGLTAASTGATLLGGAVLGVGVATAGLVQRGVPQIQSFQNSINILSQSGAKDLERLDERLRDLQKEAGKAGRAFSRSELAAALADTVKAGVSADDAFRILSESVKLAAAENTNLSETTALVLKGLRQYQLGVEDAGKVTDQLAQGGLLAAGTAEDISVGLSRVAGTGRAAGVEMSDLIGLIVELDNAGLEARDRGSNALNSALSALAALTPKAKTQLAEWNIEVNNTDGSARRAGDVLKDLGDKLRTSGIQYDESTDSLTGNGDALRGLANIMGTEGARAVLNLTGKWREYAAEVKNSDGVSRDYADTMTQGLEPAQRRAQRALDDLSKSVAQIFTPAMEGAADALDRIARQMDSISNNPLSFGNVVDAIIGADGAKRLQTVNDDIANTKTTLEEVQAALNDPKNKEVTAGQGGFHPFGLGEVDQGEVDRFVADSEQQLKLLESKLKTLQERRDTLLEQYGLGGGSSGGRKGGAKPAPKPPPTPPTPTVDPEAQAQLEQSIRAARDSATETELAAMAEGAAKIEKQRDYELALTRRAFKDETAELDTNSQAYTNLMRARDSELDKIRTGANAKLQADAQAKLQTAQALSDKIQAVSDKLAQETAQASNDPLRVISATFQQATRQIAKDTNALLDEAKKAYESGANDRATYEAQVTQIGQQGAAQQLQAQQTFTNDTKTELDRRKALVQQSARETREVYAQNDIANLRAGGDESGALKGELEAQLRTIQGNLEAELEAEGLTAAQTTAIRKQAEAEKYAARQDYTRKVAALGKEEAKTALEQAKEVQTALDASAQEVASAQVEGTSGAIPQLQARFKLEQAERAKQNAQVLKDSKGTAEQRAQLVRDQNQLESLLTKNHGAEVNKLAKDAAAQYLQALKERNAQVVQANTELRQSQIAAAQGLLEASSPGNQAEAFGRLIGLQREAALAASQLTSAARSGNSTTAEVTAAQEAEAEAHKAVRDSLTGQIDKLKSLRDEQVGIVAGGADVLSYLNDITSLTGKELTTGQGDKFVEDQARALQTLYRQNVLNNGAYEERAEIVKRLVELQQEAETQGSAFKLDPSFEKLLNANQESALFDYAGDATEAVANIKTIDEQIAGLSTQLGDATTKLTELLGEAAGDEGLNLNIKVDETGLEQAKKALLETFGEATATKLINAADSAGTRAGKGLIGAFTSGIKSNQAGLLAEVDRLLQQVRNRLPSSDARTGPLSDLTYSGGKLVTTFAGGMTAKRAHMVSAANLIASAAKPAVTVPSIPTSRALAGMGAAAAGGSSNTYHIAVDGRRGQATGMMALSAQQLARDVHRELKLRETT